jgi:hypothetical protein
LVPIEDPKQNAVKPLAVLSLQRLVVSQYSGQT